MAENYPSNIDSMIEEQEKKNNTYSSETVNNKEDYRDDVEYTTENLSLYSLRKRIEALPDVARTAEFRYLKNIPFIDKDMVKGYSKSISELEPGETCSHAEERIGDKWIVKVPTNTTYSYEDINYGLMSLEDKFRIDNVWAFAHPAVKINGNYVKIPENNTNTQYARYVYFPHHIDEVYGFGTLGKNIAMSKTGEDVLAVPDTSNGLMSSEDKSRLDKIHEFMKDMLEKGGKLQEVARTGQFKDLKFDDIENETDKKRFSDGLEYFLATDKLNGFLSAEDKAAIDKYISSDLSDKERHDSIHMTGNGYYHIPEVNTIETIGNPGQILISNGDGSASWRRESVYIGDGKGIEIINNVDSTNSEVRHSIRPIFGDVEATNAATNDGRVAHAYHTHDSWYMSRLNDTTTKGNITITDPTRGLSANNIKPYSGTVVTVGSDLTVNGVIRSNSIETSGNLDVAGNATIDRTLTVEGTTTINNSLSVTKGPITTPTLDTTRDDNSGLVKTNKLEVTGNATIGNNLNVGNDITAGKDLNVGGNTTIDKDLHVKEDATIDGTLNVGGLKLPANVTIDGHAKSAAVLKPGAKINGSMFTGQQDTEVITKGWGSKKEFIVQDNEGDYSQSNSVDGMAATATLKLPATITATLKGNADTASIAKGIEIADGSGNKHNYALSFSNGTLSINSIG